jgi:hypothetical protein
VDQWPRGDRVFAAGGGFELEELLGHAT